MRKAKIMNKFKKILLSSALLCIPAFAQMPDVGQSVNNFTLTDLNDQTHTLSDYAGKAVLLFLLTPG